VRARTENSPAAQLTAVSRKCQQLPCVTSITAARRCLQAKAFAQNAMDHSHGLTYEFVTDGTNGWLFADFDRLHGIDFAVELKGVTDLSHLNIV
jgi:hypothetical protein